MVQNLWLALCVFASCFFYGAINPVWVLPALLGPLLVLASTPSDRFISLQLQSPRLLWGSLAALSLIIAHQTVVSINPDASFIPSIVLACLPLWVLTVAVAKNPPQLWAFLTLLVTNLAVISVVDFLILQQRSHAPLVDPGNYLTLLYFAWIPWVVAALMKPLRGITLWLFLSITVVFSIAMLATHLRFAVLVLVFMVLVVVLLCFRSSSRWTTGIAIIAAIIFGGVTYLLLDPAGAASSFGDASRQATQQSPRLLLWQSTWEAVKDMGGINGTGVGTFLQVYPSFRSPAEQSTSGVVVHNDYLQLLLEGGVWLFVPLIALCAAIGLAILKGVLLGPVPEREAGLFVAMGVAALHASVNFVFSVLPLVLLFAVALALASRGLLPERCPSQSISSRRWIFGKAMICALLVLNIAYVMLHVTNLAVFAGYNQVIGAHYIRADGERALEYANLSQRLNGARGLPFFGEARLLEQKLAAEPTPMNLSRTEAAYQRSAELGGLNAAVLVNYAMFKQAVGQTQAGRDLLEEALRINPYDLFASVALLHFYETQKEPLEVQRISQQILKWCKLIAKEPGAEQLFERIKTKYVGSSADAERLEVCMRELHRPRGGGRHQTPLMRWAAGKA